MPFLRGARLGDSAPTEGYPFDLAAVQGLAAVEFATVTTLVGDNGSGKSTLVEALAAGRIRGAALDVFVQEPLP